MSQLEEAIVASEPKEFRRSDPEVKKARVREEMKRILTHLDPQPDRKGLDDTPDRVARMHNQQFDLKWLRKLLTQFGLPFNPKNVGDTMLAHYCIDERPMGRFQSHSLKNLARFRYDAPDYDIQMGKWLKAWADAGPTARARLRKQMRTYLALDCYYTARLWPDLKNEIMVGARYGQPGLCWDLAVGE